MRLRIAVLGLLFALPLWVAAETPSAEQAAVVESSTHADAGQYADALRVLAPYARSRSPETLYAWAYAHMLHATMGRAEGDADPEGIAHAVRYAERAIEGGNPAGYNLLYLIHANGYAGSRDFDKAADYLRRGAEAGEVSAKLNYALALYDGSALVPRDREQACPLIRELLEEESVQAIIAHQAGLAMIDGHCGWKPDAKSGVELIRIAASRGVAGAERDFGKALELGIGVKKDEAEALEWFERAAGHGDGEAMWKLGMAHVEGRHRDRNAAKAVEYFERAASEGSANGMASLAVMHASGDGVEQDFVKAKELYEQSARAGNAHAYRGLAVMHALGQGVPPDLVRARTLYLQAIELGDPDDPALRDMMESAMDRVAIERSDREFEEWRDSRSR